MCLWKSESAMRKREIALDAGRESVEARMVAEDDWQPGESRSSATSRGRGSDGESRSGGSGPADYQRMFGYKK